MNTDTLIRETLTNRADSYDLSLASVDEIAGAAGRRTRRSRLAGGATMLTVAALMFIGFGFADRSTEPSTLMFAGIDSADQADTPTTIIATDNGWLGATLVFDNVLTPQSETVDVLDAQAGLGEVYIATSTDGERWELAEPTGLTSTAPTFALDEHDGRHWLAVMGSDGVELAFSDDLSDWITVDLPSEANEFEREVLPGFARRSGPTKVVATSAGVMLKIDAIDHPDFESMFDRDMSNVCDLRWSAGGVLLRDCGSSESEAHENPELLSPFGFPRRGGDSNLVFSVDGNDFEVFGAATTDTRLPYSAGQSLYETDTGFGLADYQLRETDDGTTWETLEDDTLGRLTSPSFVAARGDERVAASSVLNAPIAQLFFSADGETWTSHPIDDLVNTSDQTDLSERGTPTFSVDDVVAGDAGWAVTGSFLSGSGYTFLDPDEIKPFEAEFDDLTLTGVLPGGPAELVDANGEVLYRWNRFEPRSPWRTGAMPVGIDYVFVDDNGEPLLTVPAATWNESLDDPTPLFTHVVLFSPDGMNWTKVYEDLKFIHGVSVGDDEVVVATQGELGATSLRIALGEE